MPSVIYKVLDLDGLSILSLSEKQMIDLEKRICFAHDLNPKNKAGRDFLLSLGNMKIVEVIDPDFCW